MNRRRFFLTLGAGLIAHKFPAPAVAAVAVRPTVLYMDTDSIVTSSYDIASAYPARIIKLHLSALYGKMGAPLTHLGGGVCGRPGPCGYCDESLATFERLLKAVPRSGYVAGRVEVLPFRGT